MTKRGRFTHLIRRFVTTLKGRSPLPADLEWAAELLTPPEMTLLLSMSPVDQAHGLEVARRTEAAIDEPCLDTGWVLVAAVLHDVGKVESNLGVFGRVVATLVAPVVSDATAERIDRRDGRLASLARHLRYPRLGADRLASIGCDERVCSWAAQHHSPTGEWSVPIEFGMILRDADNASS